MLAALHLRLCYTFFTNTRWSFWRELSEVGTHYDAMWFNTDMEKLTFGILGRRVPSLNPQPIVDVNNEIIDRSYLIPNYHLHLMPTQAVVYPPENKPYWPTLGIDLEYQRCRNQGVFLSTTSKYPVKLALSQLQFVNDVGRDIYYYANGKLTGLDVYLSVIRKHNADEGVHHKAYYNFVRKMISQQHLTLDDLPSQTGYTISGSEDFFIPVHAALEVTAQCNARCKHCYGAFSEVREDVMNTSNILELLDELRNAGVRAIELTGGECTTHPDFSLIFDKCVNTFDLVALLTNGIAIPNEVFEIAGKHPWNLTVQICINGKKEFHDVFVDVEGAFDLSSDSIKRFAEQGVMVRCPMNLTAENWGDMEYVCHYVAKLGASQFTAAWFDRSVGRATAFKEQCTAPFEGCLISKTLNAMALLEEKYPGFAVFSLPKAMQKMQEYDRSCGVGRRSVYITSDSVVHLCPMSIGTKIPGFGTIESYIKTETPWDNAFSRIIQRVNEPNPVDCGSCSQKCICTCIARGIRQYLKSPEECKWGQRYQLEQLLENADWTGLKPKKPLES